MDSWKGHRVSSEFRAALWRRERRRAMEKMMLIQETKSKQAKMGMWGKFMRFLRLTFWGKTG